MMGIARKSLSMVTGLMLSALVVMAGEPSLAQTPVTPSAGTAAPARQVPPPAVTSDVKQAEGTVREVTGNRLTLVDGTELTIPPSRSGQRDDLKPGASVKASYEDRGGQKLVTSIQVEPNHTFGAPAGIEGCC
jgi:hypothetical protein